MVDELDGAAELTALATAVIERAGQPADDLLLDEFRRSVVQNTEW